MMAEEDAFVEVKVPDVCPIDVLGDPEKIDFAMAAGEFMDVFGQ